MHRAHLHLVEGFRRYPGGHALISLHKMDEFAEEHRLRSAGEATRLGRPLSYRGPDRLAKRPSRAPGPSRTTDRTTRP
jgi:hypothetical protein